MMDQDEFERRLHQKDKAIADLGSALHERADQIDKYMETISELRMQLAGLRAEYKDEGIQMTQQRLSSPRREGKENCGRISNVMNTAGDVPMMDQDAQCSPCVLQGICLLLRVIFSTQDVGLQPNSQRLSQHQPRSTFSNNCPLASTFASTVTAPDGRTTSTTTTSSSSSPRPRESSHSLVDVAQPGDTSLQDDSPRSRANECVQRWKSRIREQLDDLEMLNGVMDELKRQERLRMSEQASERAGWEEEREKLRSQIEEQRVTIQKLTSSMAIHKETVEHTSDLEAARTGGSETMLQSCEDGDVQMEPKEAAIPEELSTLNAQLADANARINLLNNQVAQLESQLTSEKNAASAKEERLQTLIKCTEQLGTSAKALERRLSQSGEDRIPFLEAQLTEANNWLSDLERQLEEARDSAKDAQARVVEAETNVKGLEERLRLEASRFENEIDDQKRNQTIELEAQAKEFTKQIDQLKSEIVSLRTARDGLSSEVEVGKRQLTESSLKTKTDNAKITSLESEIQRTMELLRSAEQRLHPLEDKASQAKALEDLLQERNAKFHQQTEALTVSQTDLRAAIGELGTLRSQLMKSEEAGKEKDARIRELSDLINARERSIEEAEKRVQVAELENLKLGTRHADLIRQYDLKITAMQSEIGSFRTKLRDAEMANRELEHQLEEKKINAISAMLPHITGTNHPTPQGAVIKQESKPSIRENQPQIPEEETTSKRGRDEGHVVPSVPMNSMLLPQNGPPQIPVLSLSGFKDSPDPVMRGYSLSAKMEISELISRLGGQIVLDNKPMAPSKGSTTILDHLDANVTHVISPPTARTIKTLAAALTNRWIVGVEWIHDSIKAGGWIDESKYGFHGDSQLLAHKKIFCSSSFQSIAGGPRLAHAKLLVEEYGKGSFTDQLANAEIVFLTTKDDTSKFGDKKCLTWEQFIEYIYPKKAVSGAPQIGNNASSQPSDAISAPEKKPRIS